MAQDHLQLHGQSGSNGKEARSSSRIRFSGGGRGGGESWLKLKKIVTQKNDQGKDVSSHLIQHSSHELDDVSALITYKSFQQ